VDWVSRYRRSLEESPERPGSAAEAVRFLLDGNAENAAMTAYQLRSELRPDEQFGVGVVYGVFDVATCRVIGPDLDPTTDDTSKLATAPADAEELARLGRIIANYPAVVRHLVSRGAADV
jgi:hypothetical protein